MTARHAWKATESQGANGMAIQRCAQCDTERMPDAGTKSLYFYRGGRATAPPRRQSLGAEWRAFIAGVIPQCTGKATP